MDWFVTLRQWQRVRHRPWCVVRRVCTDKTDAPWVGPDAHHCSSLDLSSLCQPSQQGNGYISFFFGIIFSVFLHDIRESFCSYAQSIGVKKCTYWSCGLDLWPFYPKTISLLVPPKVIFYTKIEYFGFISFWGQTDWQTDGLENTTHADWHSWHSWH